MNLHPLLSDLADALRQRGWRMVTAESCTGGLIAGACTSLAGSSDWFDRGWVTYSNEAKTELLGVPASLIAAHGAVSEPVARAMAGGALARASGAQVAVSVTGIAGPGGAVPGKPVGMVCFGLATADGVVTWTEVFGGDRAEVREQTVRQALARVCALARQAA